MPPATKKQNTFTVSVKALDVVTYDGVQYGPDRPDGDTFDCRASDIDGLVALGVVAAPAATKSAE